MTVPSSYTPAQFSCNGSTVAFPFTFGVGDSDEIEVILTSAAGVETVLTPTTDYAASATNNDFSSGGTVTTVATYASGNRITIRIKTDLTQEADFTEGMATLYETFETGLDKLTRIAQQINEQLGRVPMLPKSTTTTSPPLANPIAGQYLRWNLAGTGIESTAQVSTLGMFTQSGTGAVARTVDSKLGEIFSVTDFGTIGAGDDALVVQAALDACVARGGGTVFMPWYYPYTFLTGITVDISYVSLVSDGASVDASALASGAAITVIQTTGYGNWVNALKGFRVVGGDTVGTYGVTIEAPFITIENMLFQNFDNNIVLSDHSFQVNFINVTSIYALSALVMIYNGLTDYGSEYKFFGCNFYGQKQWQIYAAAGTGSDIDFFGCSFNYADATATTARLFYIDGMKMHLYGCHVEQNAVANLDAAILLRTTDPGTGADASAAFTMSGGHLAIGDDTSATNFTSIIDADSNYPYACNVTIGKDTMMNCYCTGGELISTQTSGGAGAGRFEFNVNPIYSQLSYFFGLISKHASVDVMVDGGFEEATVNDNICVHDDSTGLTGRLVSSSVSIAIDAGDHVGGNQCLKITKTTAASAAGSAWLYIPIRAGERPFFDMWVKSTQTFAVRLRWAAAGVTGMGAFVVDTVTGGYLDIVNQKYETIVGDAFGGAGWEEVNPQSFILGGGHYHSLPVAPGWATHFVIEFDLEDVNNGAVFVDDLYINIAK